MSTRVLLAFLLILLMAGAFAYAIVRARRTRLDAYRSARFDLLTARPAADEPARS
jgi:hypothetical protein